MSENMLIIGIIASAIVCTWLAIYTVYGPLSCLLGLHSGKITDGYYRCSNCGYTDKCNKHPTSAYKKEDER